MAAVPVTMHCSATTSQYAPGQVPEATGFAIDHAVEVETLIVRVAG